MSGGEPSSIKRFQLCAADSLYTVHEMLCCLRLYKSCTVGVRDENILFLSAFAGILMGEEWVCIRCCTESGGPGGFPM